MSPDRNKESAHTKRLRGPWPLLAPVLLLLVAYAPLFVFGKPENHNDYAAWFVSGVAQVVALWLLARQYLDTLVLAAQGYEPLAARVADLELVNEDALLELHRRRIQAGHKRHDR